MRRAPLVLAVLALSAGIAAGLLRPTPVWGGPFLIPLAVMGASLAGAVTWGWQGLRRPGQGRLVLALFVGAGFLLGAAVRTGADRSCIRWLPEDRTVLVHGRVAAAAGAGVRLRVDSVRIGDRIAACSAETPARLRMEATLATGATVTAEGRWWSPPGADMGVLRRPGALLMDSLHAVIPANRPNVAEAVRRGGRDRVDKLFGEQAPLAASLLLAQRDALAPDVRARFARAGLSHLLAISGLHVGLICGILLLVGSILRMGRRRAAILAGVGTVGYVLLLGAPHSASRAALQLVLLLSATALQRPTRPESLVATAALALLALEPAALLSPGFQLSFAGVAGLLALRRPLVGLMGAADEGAGSGPLARAWRWLADALATSIAATVATAPIVAWHFSQVAPIGIVANLVAIPLLSLALPALVLALLTGWIWPAAGAFLAAPGALALRALDRVADVAADVPGGAFTVHGSSAILLTGAAVAGYLVSQRLGKVRRAVRVLSWVAVAVAVVLAAPVRPSTGVVEVHVIDVGQGDAVAVRTPARRWILVDAGIGGRGFDAGERQVIPYLVTRGARRVEGMILTHPHLDHMGGAGAVMRTMRPRWIGDPGSPAASSHYLVLLREAQRARVPWVGLRQGHVYQVDGITFTVLHPEVVGALEDDPNDLSVVVLVSYGGFRAMLTGDATALVEDRILARYGDDLAATVLKVGHHGSHTSTTPRFLAATAPIQALVSAGGGNRYGHPHAVVLERLEAAGVQILRTDRHGSIVVRADAQGRLSMETTRGGME